MYKSSPVFFPTDASFATAIGGGSQTADDAGGTGGNEAPVQRQQATEAEVLRARLAEYEGKVKSLEEKNQLLDRNWNAAQTLLKTNNDPAVTESAFRTAMAAAGYSREDIEAQLSSYRSAGGDQEDERQQQTPAPRQQGKGRTVDPEVAELNRKVDFLRQEQERQAASNQATRQTQLKTLMDQSLTTALDTNEQLATLVSRLSAMDSDSKAGAVARKQVLAQELRDTTVRRLRQRREDNGGAWHDSWVLEESNKASQEVAAKYRAVIGDPSKIGRVTETDSGDFLAQRPAIKPVDYKKGMNPETATKAINEWAVDSILRGTASSESSKI